MRVHVALFGAITLWAAVASADPPVGMKGGEARLMRISESRALALSDGPHVPHGTWYALDMKVHYSIIDGMRSDSGTFRIGDYVSAGWGVGYGSSENGNKADAFWYSLQIAAGLQAAYQISGELDVGLRGYGQLKLEPFSYVGINAEAFARVGPLFGQITYGRYDHRRADPEPNTGLRLGYQNSMFALAGRFLFDGKRYLGVEISRQAAEDYEGDITQWTFALTGGFAAF